MIDLGGDTIDQALIDIQIVSIGRIDDLSDFVTDDGVKYQRTQAGLFISGINAFNRFVRRLYGIDIGDHLNVKLNITKLTQQRFTKCLSGDRSAVRNEKCAADGGAIVLIGM